FPVAAPDAEPTGELLRGQAEQVFRQLSAATLSADALPADLARVTLYLRRVDEGDLKVIRGAMQRWFPTDDPPALSLVLVSDFPVPGAMLGADGIVGVRPSAR
ncbi:MAG: RidA family protein, partial [Gemmatimonadales bacterium]|nr:RidA family protein [Gemmatimonadales bacterium]